MLTMPDLNNTTIAHCKLVNILGLCRISKMACKYIYTDCPTKRKYDAAHPVWPPLMALNLDTLETNMVTFKGMLKKARGKHDPS